VRWADERAQALVDLLAERRLTISLSASRVLVVEQVEQLCQQAGVSERAARAYLTNDALAALADSVAFSLVDEFPGADLHTLARTVHISVSLAGRTVTALAESLLLYVEHGPGDSIGDAPLRELTVMLSLLGLFMAESDEPMVAVPPAFLVRAARKLDTAASHLDATPELTAALHRDGMRLRAAVK
jgi:hypothetical protein